MFAIPQIHDCMRKIWRISLYCDLPTRHLRVKKANNRRVLNINCTIFEPHRRLSPIPMMNGHINPPLPRLSETLPLEVPDASEWSIDDVVNYFLGVGFTEQAEVFKEQVSVNEADVALKVRMRTFQQGRNCIKINRFCTFSSKNQFKSQFATQGSLF